MLQSDFANAFDVVEEIDIKDGSDASKLARGILVQAVSEHADVTAGAKRSLIQMLRLQWLSAYSKLVS